MEPERVFTDPLLAEWQKGISGETQADINGADLQRNDTPVTVLCALVVMGTKRLTVNSDVVRLGGDIERERNQLYADLTTAVLAMGPDGTPPPTDFCLRYNAREDAREKGGSR